MLKSKAIELLGGAVGSAAKAIGVSYQAVDKWPDLLPPRIADRVLAALARKHLPAELIGDEMAGETADLFETVEDDNERLPFADLPAAVRQQAITGEG